MNTHATTTGWSHSKLVRQATMPRTENAATATKVILPATPRPKVTRSSLLGESPSCSRILGTLIAGSFWDKAVGS